MASYGWGMVKCHLMAWGMVKWHLMVGEWLSVILLGNG